MLISFAQGSDNLGAIASVAFLDGNGASNNILFYFRNLFLQSFNACLSFVLLGT
jgi:hypothetical protein